MPEVKGRALSLRRAAPAETLQASSCYPQGNEYSTAKLHILKRRPDPSGARHRAVSLEGQKLPRFWGGARVGAAVTERARWCHRMEGVWPRGPLYRQHPPPPGLSTM